MDGCNARFGCCRWFYPAGGFTLNGLVEKAWPQVSPLAPPCTVILRFYRADTIVGFSIHSDCFLVLVDFCQTRVLAFLATDAKTQISRVQRAYITVEIRGPYSTRQQDCRLPLDHKGHP